MIALEGFFLAPLIFRQLFWSFPRSPVNSLQLCFRSIAAPISPSDTFEVDFEGLDNDLPLFSSGRLDSISMVALVEFLEEETGIEVDADELTLENYDTIDSILSFYSNQ